MGYTGRISPEKNCLAIARAARFLGERGKAILYATPAAQADQILKQIHEIAGSAIRIFPPTEDVGSVLHAIDVFLLLSHTEGLSLSLLEAWAAGVPVVATRVGALADLEDQFGQLAVSVAPDAPDDELVAAVLQATHGSARINIVRRAQELVQTQFNAMRMANDWADFLTSLT